ncbi:GNAT family N-acetyltransferase [Arsukibacterium sp.]|uniref:GNAT family N-acetyltransferase n=1 Tax=Arsukibacterium sp. TaxID=1977258 RepID=UPI001BD290AD|nr:GNAT family N-acetyltransferase [Arsukibacterium sp.]
MPVTACLQPLLAEAAARQIRLPVLLQGKQDELLPQCQQLIATIAPQTLYWLGEQAPAASTQLKPGNNYQLLGSECDMLVVNAFSGFNADLTAASAGCLKAGGLWLILAPTDEHWCQQPNPAHSALLPYPLDPQQHHGQFIRFWLARLTECQLLKLTLNNSTLNLSQPLKLPDLQPSSAVAAPYASIEQQLAVAAILKVVSGHRRRPLVLVADRGRGKSAALGLAAALLVQQGKKRLVITAASPNAAATAISHYQQQLPDTPGLCFIAVDQLLLEQPELDLLLIDEAAALPTAVLKQLADRYSRIVFATTEHGYEGTGRGFQLRFQRYLDETQKGWKRLQIVQPVRYQQQDPLEQLIFNSFLLKQVSADPTFQPGQALQLRQFQHNHWLTEPEQLADVFHLLSLAHYQTQVKDLAALLDNPQLTVVALYQRDQLLACALLSYEGELASELCQKIYQGDRRVQGHLLAQSLAFHLAQPQLASQRLVRVMRIAVVRPLQRHGLGSHLLAELANLLKQQNIDWLGTSFGVSPGLLAFWQAADYTPVRLSNFADNASSEPSVLMLKPINGNKQLVQQLNQQSGNELYHCLQEYPANLSFDVIRKLVLPPTVALDETDIGQLQLFAQGKRPYQLVARQLLYWFNLHYLQLEPAASAVLAARLWQKQSWQTIGKRFQLAGKAACIKLIQQQISSSLA